MSLSLDDVRNKRFRMARKSGYEVLEVDEFVDEVEATFEQLFQENQNLKKQVDALRSSSGSVVAETTEAPTTPSAAEPPAAGPATPAAEPAERIVVTTSQEASTAVVRLVQLSTEQAEQLVAEATAEAVRIREQAGSSAQQVTTEAQQRADQLQADAKSRAEALDRELATRRTAMFGDLEKQREQLSSTVAALRTFESTYRTNLTRHLKSQIDVLASGREEPADPPAGLGETSVRPPTAAPAAEQTPAAGADAATGTASSDTPRLDALLGDQR